MRARRRSSMARALAFAALLPGVIASAATATAAVTAAAATATGAATASATVATPSLATDNAASLLPGAAPGDAARGRAIVANRQLSLCLLCHTDPIPEERFQGNLAPDLRGAGQRWSADQLRQRIADASQFNPSTIMPAYYKTEGLNRVAANYKDKTILNAQQIEDVVAWLQTLKEPAP